MLERLFHLSENNTTVRTEVLAGVTTFMTMSYILFVQPAVLSTTGMDFQAVLAATCIVSAFGCFRWPFLRTIPSPSLLRWDTTFSSHSRWLRAWAIPGRSRSEPFSFRG